MSDPIFSIRVGAENCGNPIGAPLVRLPLFLDRLIIYSLPFEALNLELPYTYYVGRQFFLGSFQLPSISIRSSLFPLPEITSIQV